MSDALPPEPSSRSIARTLDHSLLRPTFDLAVLEAGCGDAVSFGAASLCIVPFFVERAARLLQGSEVVACTVVGFPHGTSSTESKVFEAHRALEDGARELDAVVNVGRVLSSEWSEVALEVERLVQASHDAGARLKLIFENCYLEDRHKIELCRIASDAGVDWVKTSTGFGSGGATVHDVKLMREHSAKSVQVKASGGISDLDSVLEYLKLGATRIGTSKTRTILEQARERFGG